MGAETGPISYTAVPLFRSAEARWTSADDGSGEVTWWPT
jgi:hypothetical protein